MWKNKRKEIVAFSIPLLILMGMSVTPTLTMLKGEEIQLKVESAYNVNENQFTLDYEVEGVLPSKIDKDIQKYFLTNGYDDLTVYSILKENDEGYYEVAKVVSEKPTSGYYLEGKMHSFMEGMDEVYIDNDITNRITSTEFLDKLNPEEYIYSLQSEEMDETIIATVKWRDGQAIVDSVSLK